MKNFKIQYYFIKNFIILLKIYKYLGNMKYKLIKLQFHKIIILNKLIDTIFSQITFKKIMSWHFYDLFIFYITGNYLFQGKTKNLKKSFRLIFPFICSFIKVF